MHLLILHSIAVSNKYLCFLAFEVSGKKVRIKTKWSPLLYANKYLKMDIDELSYKNIRKNDTNLVFLLGSNISLHMQDRFC